MRALVLVIALALIFAAGIPVAANGVRHTPSPAQPGEGPAVVPSQPEATEQPETTTAPEEQPMAPSSTGAGVACPTPTTSMLTEDQVIQQCLASGLGMSAADVSRLHSQGLSYSDIAMAQAIAMRTCKPISEVITTYNSCSQNWNQVASTYNISLMDVQTAPMVASSDVETFNRNFVAQYYGLSSSDIASLRNQGFSWADINFIANAAARTGQPVSTIASLRTQGMCWTDIATRYNTTVAMISTPVGSRVVTTATIAPVGAGPMIPGTVMYDLRGNVLLTADQAQFFYRNGYDWLDVAIAANVSKYSGVPMDYLLSRIRQGVLWSTLMAQYGVSPRQAFNVTNYPFARVSVYNDKIEQKRINRIQGYQVPMDSLQPASPASPMIREPFVSTPQY